MATLDGVLHAASILRMLVPVPQCATTDDNDDPQFAIWAYRRVDGIHSNDSYVLKGENAFYHCRAMLLDALFYELVHPVFMSASWAVNFVGVSIDINAEIGLDSFGLFI